MAYSVEMIRVRSEAIAAIGYDGGTLYVEFHSGKTYSHPRVPYSVYVDFLNARSHGTFYNQHIKGKYK